jgi:integrase
MSAIAVCSSECSSVVQVSHQVQDRCGHTVVRPPKTEASVRTLALDHGLVAALRTLRREQAGEPIGFLFTNQHGGLLSPGYVTHTFSRLVAEAGLPPIRLHDLRHGAASLSLAAGNDLKVVQAMFGHSSIRAAEATAAPVLEAARDAAASWRGRGSGKQTSARQRKPRPRQEGQEQGRQARPHSAPRRSHP